MTGRRTVSLLAGALLVAGCSGGGEDGEADAPATTPPPPAATAADGTNLKACADGECEVSVRVGDKITLPAKLTGVAFVVVTEVGENTVKFSTDGGGYISTGPGGTVTMNHLGVLVPAIQGNTAIVALSVQ